MKALALLVIVAFFAVCSCSRPNDNDRSKPQADRINLSQIMDKNISISMCGMELTLPRDYVFHIKTNGHEGISSEPITETVAYIEFGRYAGVPGEGGLTSAVGSIACRDKPLGAKYRRPLDAFVMSSAYETEFGLTRFVSRDLAGPRYYFVPTNDSAEDGFYLACYQTVGGLGFGKCIINGDPYPTLNFVIYLQTRGDLSHWRLYKNSFENFIKLGHKK